MTRYVVRYNNVNLSLAVHVDAETEEEAEDAAWRKGEDYLQTLGNFRDISADASLDGMGNDAIEEVEDE